MLGNSLIVFTLISVLPVGERFERVFITDGASSVYFLEQPVDSSGLEPVLILGSDSVFVYNNTRGFSPLSRSEFLLDPAAGVLVLFVRLPEWSSIRVVYRVLFFSGLKRKPVKDELKTVSAEGETGAVKVAKIDTVSEGTFGDWSLSGSKSLGFSLGSTEGLGIDQATRVGIFGTVAGVEVEAELSDQGSPIPPEGRTLDIEELDRIGIQVRGRGWQGSFGDVELEMGVGNFGTVQRKAVGGVIKGENEIFSLTGGYARPRGEFGRVDVTGIDGVQGPYPLAPDGRAAEIVPGTEVVYLDGKRLVRGWDADYTVDYATGELTFTNRHIITQSSRIEAEFQFVTDAYERTEVVAGAGFVRGPFQVNANFFQEGDDPERSLAIELSPEEKIALGALGGDTSRAWLSGGIFVGSGNGDYVLEKGYFRFVGTGSGDYRVSFTLRGDSLGGYVYDETLGGFRYVGKGNGNYVDSIRVVLPKREQVIYSRAGVRYGGVVAGLEGAFCRRFVNLFAQDGAMTDAGGVNIDLGWQGSAFGIGYRHKGVEPGFYLPGASKEVDFSYRWAGTKESERKSSDEIFFRAVPFSWLELNTELGRLNRFNNQGINRMSGGCQVSFFRCAGFWVDDFRRLEIGLAPVVGWVSPRGGWSQERKGISRTQQWRFGLGVKPRDNFTVSGELQLDGFEELDSIFRVWRPAKQNRLLQLNGEWRWQDFLRLNGLGGYQEMDFYNAGSSDWRRFFGTVNVSWTPRPGFSFAADLDQTYRQVQLRDEQFRYAGPGGGDYRRDSITGEYAYDPNGDYERVVVFLGKFAAAREFAVNGRAEITVLAPVDFYASFSRNRIDADTGVLNDFSRFDMRADIKALEEVLVPAVGVSGDMSVDRTLSITGKMTARRQGFLELSSDRIANVELRGKVSHSRLVRRLNSGAVDYDEMGWRFSLTTILGEKLRLEVGFAGEPKEFAEPIVYPELGRFRLIGWEGWVGKTHTFRVRTRVRIQGGVSFRRASVAVLPWDVELAHPLGWTPYSSATLEHLFSDVLSANVRYSYRDRQNQPAEHNFSLELRANF